MKKVIFLTTVLALFIFTSCASLTGRTVGEHIDDATITSTINAKIIEDPELSYLKINVDTTRGNVVLSGFIASKKAEERLIESIRTIRGVKSVTSHLKIEQRK